jgi:NTP pyrophosphatase (non-canonical NTP hydrolase)
MSLSLKEYQQLAKRTFKDLGTDQKNLLHMKMGLMTEIGEILDALKKHIAYGKELDVVNMREEWGDAMWYIANYYTIKGKELHFEAESVFDLFFYMSSKNNPEFTLLQNMANVLCRNNMSFDETAALIWSMGKNFTKVDEEKGDLLQLNIDKLRKRYPEKYSDEQALVRDTDAERKILENRQNQNQ